ncbi:MAG: metal-dependent hydrolase [Gemmatimonadaceae bacterium]|nr:metal-dependent hydrolase [Gemmatimonadaceae bacterium]
MVRARGSALPNSTRAPLVLAGVVAAELPDIDLAWSGLGRGGEGALRYMLHHRGHTHTLVVALAGALLVWGLWLALRRDLRNATASRPRLGIALLGTLSHVLLDWTNSYGVHPFWPWENRWFYGDAIFIVEPWLWVVAIPAVMLGDRSRTGRVVLALLLAAILVATWWTDYTAWTVALALTAGMAVLFAVSRRVADLSRVLVAIAAWVAVEATFFITRRAAEREVRAAAPMAADVVLSPGVADPFCWSAIALWEDATTYQVRGGEVRPMPSLRDAGGCRVRSASGLREVSLAGTATVRWTGQWTAPAGALTALAQRDCRLAAALRFMRVPAWERTATGVTLWDLRYGQGGFASVTSTGSAPCPRDVPPWDPPTARWLPS